MTVVVEMSFWDLTLQNKGAIIALDNRISLLRLMRRWVRFAILRPGKGSRVGARGKREGQIWGSVSQTGPFLLYPGGMNMSEKLSEAVIFVRAPGRLVNALDAEAERRTISKSALVRLLLIQELGLPTSAPTSRPTSDQDAG